MIDARAEGAAFGAAREAIECDGPDRVHGIEMMIELAIEGVSGVAQWARRYMREVFNAEIHGTHHNATSEEAGRI